MVNPLTLLFSEKLKRITSWAGASIINNPSVAGINRHTLFSSKYILPFSIFRELGINGS
jgi:hypothetical protein